MTNEKHIGKIKQLNSRMTGLNEHIKTKEKEHQEMVQSYQLQMRQNAKDLMAMDDAIGVKDDLLDVKYKVIKSYQTSIKVKDQALAD